MQEFPWARLPHTSLRTRQRDMFATLFEHRSDVNACDSETRTAFHRANSALSAKDPTHNPTKAEANLNTAGLINRRPLQIVTAAGNWAFTRIFIHFGKALLYKLGYGDSGGVSNILFSE
ncbi:hypothetical protein N7G274_007562 [Stereocaulon virgatum]|uniref:Uncharacterized protein n=1 Tax=Stereocaulon virgatum TaxID=373712 RepID=A0ABR4A238_9LECA